MKITVFGATGFVGRKIVEEALLRGHAVRAFSRNIAHGNGHQKKYEIYPGNALDDQSVKGAVKNVDAVISALGQRSGGKVDLMSSSMKNIIRAMEEEGVSRIIAVGGAGILQAEEKILVRDQRNFPPFLQEVSADHLRVFHLLRKSTLNWTIVCPPFIQEGEKTGRYQVRRNYPPEGKPQILSGDLADFIVEELENPRFPRARVGIRRLKG